MITLNLFCCMAGWLALPGTCPTPPWVTYPCSSRHPTLPTASSPTHFTCAPYWSLCCWHMSCSFLFNPLPRGPVRRDTSSGYAVSPRLFSFSLPKNFIWILGSNPSSGLQSGSPVSASKPHWFLSSEAKLFMSWLKGRMPLA